MTLLRLAVEGEVCASAPDIEIEAERFLFVEARVIARFQTFVVVGRERGVLRGQKSFVALELLRADETLVHPIVALGRPAGEATALYRLPIAQSAFQSQPGFWFAIGQLIHAEPS